MSKDWTQIYEKYKGQWVALAEDEQTVLAYGKTAKEALVNAQAKGHTEPLLARMPKELTAYVGYGV